MQASLKGYDTFVKCADREDIPTMRCNRFDVGYLSNNKAHYNVHRYSSELLRRCQMVQEREPVDIPADGSCFYHALSFTLSGDLRYSVELRVRCCLELVQNRAYYLSHPRKDEFQLVSSTFQSACLDSAKECGWSGVFTIQAASNVLGRSIISVYPQIGARNVYYDTLNTTLNPRKSESSNAIYVMWSRPGPPIFRNNEWVTNHFVPLVLKRDDLNRKSGYMPRFQMVGHRLVFVKVSLEKFK
jgi:hypothetical protein